MNNTGDIMSSNTISLARDRRKNLVSIAWLAAFLTLPTAVYDVYLGLVNGFTNRSVFFFLAAAVLFILFFTSITIIRSKHAEKTTFGTWHLLIPLSITFLLSSALQSNVGAEMGMAFMIISIVISIQTLPPNQVLRGAILGAGVSLLASLLAFYSPLPQEIDPRIDTVTIWIARGATVIILGIAMTQFRSMSLSSKLLITFLGVVVLISLMFNILMTSTTTKTLTERIGQELHSVADGRSIVTGDYLNGHLDVLQTLALDETIRQSVRAANALKPELTDILELDEQWQRAVASGESSSLVNSKLSNSLSNDLIAFQNLSPEHVEVFVTDQAGALVSATNMTSDYYQADEEWWIETFNEGFGDVYISQPEFDISAGKLSILLAVPIFDTRQGGLIGILRSTVSLDSLITILKAPIGNTGEAAIFFSDGSMLDTEEAKYKVLDSESLRAIEETDRQIYTRAYFEEQDRFVSRGVVRSQVLDSPINNLGWNIVVYQNSNEALASVSEQVRTSSFFGTLMAGIAALLSLLVAQRLSGPITNLTDTANKIARGDLTARAKIESQDEIGQLSETFNIMTSQLQETLQGLEVTVAERTAELEESAQRLQKRAKQFESIAQLARTITSIQELEALLPRITQQVSQQFGFYHVGLFLLDESHQYAVLTAANSEGGQNMLARKHRLGVGQTGIVGYVTSTGNPRIALDTGADAVYFDNPDLPDTRSEMALPLRVGRTVVGALDVQSTEPNAFSEDDVEVLSILADEISVAIENARLFEESQRVLADAQSAFGEFTKSAWQKTLAKQKIVGYELSGASIRSLDGPTNGNGSSMSVPIKLRDRVIGSMNINLPKDKELDQDETDITQALAQRIGTAIETATLLEETRRRATRESLISDISAKLSATAEIEHLMQVAVGELRDALGASEVTLKIENNQ
jgi:GAF domain-containing protein/HAMP domain-containing protein